MVLIDIGVNLADASFDRDRDAVIERATAAGVGHMIVTGMGLDESERALALAEQHSGTMRCTAGIHPHLATRWTDSPHEARERLGGVLDNELAVAAGECGLDYFRNLSPPEAQRAAFAGQLELAAEHGKPVFLHQRDAHDDFLAILKEHEVGGLGGVAHCFTGGPEQAESYLELGLYIGITGWVLDKRRNHELLKAIPLIPLAAGNRQPLPAAAASGRQAAQQTPQRAGIPALCRPGPGAPHAPGPGRTRRRRARQHPQAVRMARTGGCPMSQELVFYTNPMSRGQIARWMLEEVGADYRTEVLQYGPEMKSEDFLAVNPMGKVPTIRHGDVVVTEAAAICAYLADAFPDAGLAPPPGQRGAYYRWMFFAAGPLEAATINRALKFEVPPERESMIGYGTLEAVLDTLEAAVSASEFIAGPNFSAADVYVGSHLSFAFQFGSLEKRPAFVDYWSRLENRPARLRAVAIDNALMPKSSQETE